MKRYAFFAAAAADCGEHMLRACQRKDSGGELRGPSLLLWGALFFASIEAPGITPPEASTTVPESEAVAPPDCAYADEVIAASSAAISTKTRTFIAPPGTGKTDRSTHATGQCPESGALEGWKITVGLPGVNGKCHEMSHICVGLVTETMDLVSNPSPFPKDLYGVRFGSDWGLTRI